MHLSFSKVKRPIHTKSSEEWHSVPASTIERGQLKAQALV